MFLLETGGPRLGGPGVPPDTFRTNYALKAACKHLGKLMLKTNGTYYRINPHWLQFPIFGHLRCHETPKPPILQQLSNDCSVLSSQSLRHDIKNKSKTLLDLPRSHPAQFRLI